MTFIEEPIRRHAAASTVIESCVRRLRGAIMVGDLRPGQKLVEADLCRDLGASRASVREALRALEADRLIELLHNRGPSVAKLGEQEIEEIHDVWALLTSETVYRFARLATDGDIARLESIMGRLKDALQAKNPLRQLNVTNSFFSHISEKCGNDMLVDIVTGLVSRLNFLRAQSLRHDGWREQCAIEIEAILKAIRQRKPLAARRAAQRHIESACRAATKIATMPNPEPGKAPGNVTRFATMARWSRPKRTRRD